MSSQQYKRAQDVFGYRPRSVGQRATDLPAPWRPMGPAQWVAQNLQQTMNQPLATPNYAQAAQLSPLREGLRFGMVGALTGLGTAAVQDMIRRQSAMSGRGARYANAMLIGALIGGGLGTVMGGGSRAQALNPGPKPSELWRGPPDPTEKQGQWMSTPDVYGKTLYDLYREIRQDPSLSDFEQQRLVNQLEGVTRGSPPGTPLGVLLASGLGGTIGWLISKYFGMSPTGKVVTALLGAGIGKKLYDEYNKPPSPAPGWKVI